MRDASFRGQAPKAALLRRLALETRAERELVAASAASAASVSRRSGSTADCFARGAGATRRGSRAAVGADGSARPAAACVAS
jgi:hypothetical protein